MWATTERSTGSTGPLGRLARTRPRLVVVDNYDSFTHNLTHALELAGARCRLIPHDATGVEQLLAGPLDGLVLSAGPCTPTEAGISIEIVRVLCERRHWLPLLGVCLGHQVIACALGGSVQRAQQPVHGKLRAIWHDGNGVFADLPNPLEATCYNSLVVRQRDLPPELQPCALNPLGELMALRHRELPITGIQFHPESVLSIHGPRLLSAWVESLRVLPPEACARPSARAECARS